MKIKLFKRFYFATALIIVVCLSFMLMTISFFVSNHLSNEKYRSLSRNCDVVCKLVSNNQQNYSDEMLRSVLLAVDRASECNIFITDKNANVLICSCDIWTQNSSCEHSLAKIPLDILSEAKNGTLKKLGNFDGGLSEVCFMTAQKVTNVDNNEYIVFALSAASNKNMFFDSLFKMYIVAAVVPLALIFVIEYILIYRITKPLKMMSDAARAMATGDFSKRIPVVSDDEIGELSIAFNQMTNSLAKLETARRNFVANVSHEFRTPITTIGGFIDGIIDGTIDSDRQGYYLNIVSKEVKRLTRLVKSMLSLSRLESGETQINASSFDIRETLINIVLSQEQRIEAKNINIVGLDKLDNCEILADTDLIHQVIYNLVDNAIKFTNNKGYIAFALNSVQDIVVFKIKNSGDGISKSNIEHIFDRFYKIDRSRSENSQSTGLGLYIAKTIIDIHSGTISVSCEENNYTEFVVSLPINTVQGVSENGK